jgi:predicted transcriptional regulator
MKTTQNQIFVKKNLDYALGLGLIEHLTKEDFFRMKTTQNQKFVPKSIWIML